MKISFITFGSKSVVNADADPGLVIHLDPPPLAELGDTVIMQLAPEQEGHAEDYAFQIRRNEEICLKPVFFISPPTRPRLIEFGNGALSNLSLIKLTTERMADRSRSLAPNALKMGPEVRLISMLYVFDKRLNPLEDPCCAVQYRYPLAETQLGEKEESMRFVESMHERGLLEGVEILDRVRHCTNCWSTQLNYLDVCENCGSLRIEQTTFLHCFTCGYVDSEQAFMESGQMVCPNCHTRLRNPGSDYDKTLESYICQDCKTKQVEPRVIARCLRCGHKNDPDDLLPQNIYSFRITSKAEQTAFLGNLDALLSSLDILDFVPFEVFTYLLEWQMRMHKRYPENLFAVVALRMNNLAEQTRKFGSARVVRLIDQLCRALRDVVRTTDVVSRSDNTTIWFLLPMITREGGEIVVSRIQKMQRTLELEDGSRLEFRAQIWFPKDKDPIPVTPSDVFNGIDRLLGR